MPGGYLRRLEDTIFLQLPVRNVLAALLGLMSGDTLQSINGYDLSGFEDQITAYQKLAEETSLYVTIDRATGPVTLHYELVK